MGRYLLLDMLGEGGMGCVYEAFDPELDRKFALKVLRPDLGDEGTSGPTYAIRARMVREAKSLAKLAHPNVVPIYDVGLVDDGSVFLAMELVRGLTLREWLSERKRSWHEVVPVLVQVGEGLVAAHRAGLLHRDIKPANILVGHDGVVRLLDFGLAKIRGQETSPTSDERQPVLLDPLGHAGDPSSGNEELTQLGSVLGTPAYFAPEVLRRGEFSESTDLFALGCVAYEALTGNKPFSCDGLDHRLASIRRPDFVWPKSVPHWLQKQVVSAIRFEASERDPSVQAWLEALRHAESVARRRTQARRIAGAVAGIAACAVATQFLPQPSSVVDPECESPPTRASQILASEALLRAEEGFQRTKLSMAPQLWQDAELKLQSWRENWLESRTQLCPAVRKALGGVPFDLAQREQAKACFQEAAGEVSTILDIWQRATAAHVLEATSTKHRRCWRCQPQRWRAGPLKKRFLVADGKSTPNGQRPAIGARLRSPSVRDFAAHRWRARAPARSLSRTSRSHRLGVRAKRAGI
jgi:serine/threonine protein kinase